MFGLTSVLTAVSDYVLLSGGHNPQEIEEIWGSNPPPPSQNSQLQITAANWQIETKSDAAFSQITLDFILYDIIQNYTICLVMHKQHDKEKQYHSNFSKTVSSRC